MAAANRAGRLASRVMQAGNDARRAEQAAAEELADAERATLHRVAVYLGRMAIHLSDLDDRRRLLAWVKAVRDNALDAD